MKGLFLCGANSTSMIWAKTLDKLKIQADTVDYPHEVLQKAHSIAELTKWVYNNYSIQDYNFIVGHSMGGFVALELTKDYSCEFKEIILVETNLKPAGSFYRNLMTRENMEKHGKEVIDMINSEAIFYQKSLIQSIQEDFDYSSYVQNIPQPVHILYGDRGVDVYADRINDLCLDESTLKNIKFYFIENSCHMPMLENPEQLVNIIMQIICSKHMVINTERCIIRPFEESDIDNFMKYRNDMDWMQYQGFKGLDKQKYINALVGKFSLRDGAQLAITCKKEKTIIGDVYIKEEDAAYWIGYTITPSKSRQGYAYEAVSAVIDELKAKGAVCIKAGVESENIASIALLKKLKFQYIETNNDEQIFVLN